MRREWSGKRGHPVFPNSRSESYTLRPLFRDSLDTTLRYNAHAKFVQKWLELLEQEAKGHEVQAPEAEHLVEPAADGETQSSEPQ